MSKKSDERETPNELFEELHKEFNFQYDLAASDNLHKLPNYFTKENSAFKYNWIGNNFCNPPYSDIKPWLYYATKQKALTVFILPCDTSTGWFHNYLWDKKLHCPRINVHLRFPQGRYKFSNINSPKFATIIAIIDNR